MLIEGNFDGPTKHWRRQSPPMRVGVVPDSTSSNTTKYAVTGIFAALALIVCSVTIYLWLKHRRKDNYKISNFNEGEGQAWKLDDQQPPDPTPGGDAKPAYGGKGGHDAGPEQEQGLLANAAEPGHAPRGSAIELTTLPYSHSNSSFHSAASTPGRYSYDSKGQRLSSSSHDPNCPVHSSHHGQPCPVHSHQRQYRASGSGGSGLRPSSYMPPPASTYNTVGPPPTNPNFYAAQQAQQTKAQQKGQRPQSTVPARHSPPPQYASRPSSAQVGSPQQEQQRQQQLLLQQQIQQQLQQQHQQQQQRAPPAALVPGPPTSQRPQHQFSNPYNHHRRPSATNQLQPLFLTSSAGGGGQADSYYDANSSALETPTEMPALQTRRDSSTDRRGRERERDFTFPTGPARSERGMSVDTVVPADNNLTTPNSGGANRGRRLSIGVPVIARTRSGRIRQQSVDTRPPPAWTDERGRLSVLQVEGVGRERGRSVSPRRSFELEGGDVGESLLGRGGRARLWGEEEVDR